MSSSKELFTRFSMLVNVVRYCGYADFVVNTLRQINKASYQTLNQFFDEIVMVGPKRTLKIRNFADQIMCSLENGKKYKLFALDITIDCHTNSNIENLIKLISKYPGIVFEGITLPDINHSSISLVNNLVEHLLNSDHIANDAKALFKILSIKKYYLSTSYSGETPLYTDYFEPKEFSKHHNYKFVKYLSLDYADHGGFDYNPKTELIYIDCDKVLSLNKSYFTNSEFVKNVTEITIINVNEYYNCNVTETHYDHLKSIFHNLKNLNICIYWYDFKALFIQQLSNLGFQMDIIL